MTDSGPTVRRISIGAFAIWLMLIAIQYDYVPGLRSAWGFHLLRTLPSWVGWLLAGAALLVNTTTLGMEGQPPLEMALDDLPGGAVVNDIVYAPLETDLLARARGRGNPAVDGLGMLLHQARPGFEAWFGVAPEVTTELRAFVLAT